MSERRRKGASAVFGRRLWLLPETKPSGLCDDAGAGTITEPQIIAEIGDVRRFTHKGALVAFAGVDVPPFQSGTFDSKNRHVSKRGSPHLRAALFRVCSVILQCKDERNAVYAFMDRKRAEGKHYYVYMVAGAAKFLRIYYARVKECLAAA